MDPFMKEESHYTVTSATTPPDSSNNVVLGSPSQDIPAVESVVKEETQGGFTGQSAPAKTTLNENNDTKYSLALDDTSTMKQDLRSGETDSISEGETIDHGLPIDPMYLAVWESRSDLAFLHNLEDQYDNGRLLKKVKDCAVQVNKVTSQQEKRAVEEKAELDKALENLCRIVNLSSRLVKVTDLRNVFMVFRLPKYVFSDVTSEVVQELETKFENQRWGEAPTLAATQATSSTDAVSDDNKDDSEDSDEDDDEGFVTGPSKEQNNQGKRSKPDLQQILVLPKGYSIYGPGEIMDGIRLRQNTTFSPERVTTSRILDPGKTHASAKVFGHNSIEAGTWWPKQICLVRDGAHGCIQGGIYGNVEEGTFSIIVSGTYSDLDQDLGAVLYYSAPKPRDDLGAAKEKNSDRSKILRTSLHTQKLVRVIRGASKHSEYAPKVGLRYDGLYRVASEETGKTVKGVTLALFKLVRKPNQLAIDKDTPSAEQQKLFRRVKLQY